MYSVQFVGLACFVRAPGERLVLLPDGRTPENGIEPHFASIVVPSDAVQDASGWDAEERERGNFSLPPCSIVFEGANVGDGLDTSEHDGRLPELRRINPEFWIDPQHAEQGTIATVEIRRGKLTAYSIPGGKAVISQLDVPHEDAIEVTVAPRDGSPVRTLRLAPGTEIALANTARGYADEADTPDHFRIYEKLSASPATLAEPSLQQELPASPSRHPLFLRKLPHGLSISCSNTGCC